MLDLWIVSIAMAVTHLGHDFAGGNYEEIQVKVVLLSRR